MASLIVGVGALAISVWGLLRWRAEFLFVMKGFLPFCLLMGGLVAVIAGASSLFSRPTGGSGDKSDRKS
jgi:hypothetical protein